MPNMKNYRWYTFYLKYMGIHINKSNKITVQALPVHLISTIVPVNTYTCITMVQHQGTFLIAINENIAQHKIAT